MEQVSQGSGGVTIPGGAIKMSGCGSSQYGLVGMVASQRFDLMVLEVFSNFN